MIWRAIVPVTFGALILVRVVQLLALACEWAWKRFWSDEAS